MTSTINIICWRGWSAGIVALLLTACGGGGSSDDGRQTPPAPTYSVSGMATGLGGPVVLQNNLKDDLSISADGDFTFAAKLGNASAYSVSILTQPPALTCSISNGVGVISGSDITDVAVVCSAKSYSVGGTVSGLVGTVLLQNNHGDNLTVTANGNFSFSTPLANGAKYEVTVLAQPTGMSCTVARATGTISDAAVGNVAVTCVAAPVSVAIDPLSVSIAPGATRLFTATVSGSDNTSVLWSVVETGGCGTVNGNGLYTAPATVPAGTCHIKATSIADDSKSATATITVVTEPLPEVIVSTLPAGMVGSFYTTTLAATGGSSPYTWSIASGALPDGLTLAAASGLISGTPTATGTSSFTVRATDTKSASGTKGLSIAVAKDQQCSATAVGFDDQQDRLEVPPGAWPASTSSWTFASWIRINIDRNQASPFFTIETPEGHSEEYNELTTDDDGTTLTFWDHKNGAAITLGTLTPGTWYFVAVSVGPGGVLTTYMAKDGGTLAKQTGTAAVLNHIEMSFIGASNFKAVEYLNGAMSRVRLWNGVLSDSEVNAEFASAVPVRTSGLIGDWRLASKETAGDDSSALGHHLSLIYGATHDTVTGPGCP